MYIYYGFFIILGYALTVNFFEGLTLFMLFLLLILSIAFVYGFRELIKE